MGPPRSRRSFLRGALKATAFAGVAGRLSLREILAAGRAAGPNGGRAAGSEGAAATASAAARVERRYDGELFAESYEAAHRLRDGTLKIPTLVPEGRLHDAIVIGGGVSGLMAAWELQRGGLEDVVLYEKEDYFGGNARKSNANGTDYTCATWSVARPKDAFLTRLFQDLDILDGFAADGTPKIRPELLGPGPDYNTLIDGRWYREQDQLGTADAAVETLPIPARDRKDLAEFYRDFEVWAKARGRDGKPAFAMPVEEGSRDPDILALDTITMEEYVRRKGWGERAARAAEEWSSSDVGGSIAEVSAYGFWAFNSLGQGGEDITLPGGNAWLAERLAAKVGPDRLRRGLTAVQVRTEGNEGRVVFLDPRTLRFSERRARTVVIACPKHITGRMVPGLAAAGRRQYQSYRYGALLMGAASVRRTPKLAGAPLAWYNSAECSLAQGFLVADYNSERWRKADPARPNVLCLWAPLAGKATRAELLVEPWARWADALADDLETMVPGIRDDITRLDVYAWGHHMVIPYPGFLTGPDRAALTRPLGRITFAHSDRNGMPSFELATRAGYDAAREAVAIVRAPGGAARRQARASGAATVVPSPHPILKTR